MSCKIRIAEDNKNDRSLLWDISAFHDYEASVAAGGHEGAGPVREPMPEEERL